LKAGRFHGQNGTDVITLLAMKRAKSLPAHVPKPRNPVARSPLLAKGGAHGKSMAAKRRQAKIETARLAREPETE